MAEGIRSKYFAETACVLQREGFQVEQLQNGHLNVLLDDRPLCEVNRIGGIMQREFSDPERLKAIDKALEIVDTTAEYIRGMELASPLGVNELKDRYKVLADFNGTILACAHGESGVEFVTWDWDAKHVGVSNEHYFGVDYNGAKQDFVTRSGMIPKRRVFTDDQLVQIYLCCSDALNADYGLTYAHVKCIGSIQAQIQSGIPDIMDRVQENSRREHYLHVMGGKECSLDNGGKKLKSIVFKIDEQLFRDIHIRAAERGKSVQDYVCSLIKTDLTQNTDPDQVLGTLLDKITDVQASLRLADRLLGNSAKQLQEKAEDMAEKTEMGGIQFG